MTDKHTPDPAKVEQARGIAALYWADVPKMAERISKGWEDDSNLIVGITLGLNAGNGIMVRKIKGLQDACQEMADDFQVSASHHPQHVLVQIAAFDKMRVYLRTLKILEQRQNDDRSPVSTLRAALKAARGWVVTCSESEQARRDLKTIDKVLGLTRPGEPS